MGKLVKVFRGFTDEFVRYMRAKDAWPPYKVVKGIRTNAYKQVRHGAVIDEKYTERIVRVIFERPASDVSRQALTQFFRTHDWPAPDTLSVLEVLDRICTPLDDHGSPAIGMLDYLGRGIPGMVEAFAGAEWWDKFVQCCDDETDVNPTYSPSRILTSDVWGGDRHVGR